MRATCQCGQLTAEIPGPSDQIVACHCHACQRRSGSPFGLVAYYPAADVSITGEAREYTRATDSGSTFTNAFCPTCGTTVFCRAGIKPAVIGIPVGTLADPAYPAPVRSVWEQAKHSWVAIPGNIPHFPQGRS
ncbi:MAG: hypothetical protein RIS94_2865 [Pseudomonadota bacterium]|jgi:hypothetical protein